MKLLAILLVVMQAYSTAKAAEPEQVGTRSFGYFIGDIVEQRIILPAGSTNLASIELPAEGRVGQWLQRLSSTMNFAESGQALLKIHYQVINSPLQTVATELPSISLELGREKMFDSLTHEIAISPLTPQRLDAMPSMRPDRRPVPPNIEQPVRRLKLLSLALAITLLSWLSWWLWRGYSDARRLPFARARLYLRQHSGKSLDDNAQAWQTMHHAFNEAAGRTIHAASIAGLIQQKPWLQSLRAQIETFYEASSSRFFAQQQAPDCFSLDELSRALYLIEKQHSSGRRELR